MHDRPIRVAALTAVPVKGLRLCEHRRLELDRGGVRGDRRLYLVDDDGRMFNGKRSGALQQVKADLDEPAARLTLRFPDGSVIAEPLRTGAPVETMFFSEARPARMIDGSFSAALSRHVGTRLRLVFAADGSSAVDRGAQGCVSLISRASLSALAQRAGHTTIDARRFRMSIELDGCAAFEEDGWVGRELSVGVVRLKVHGHIGRCLVTSRDPLSGEVDLPTLDLLRLLREDATTTDPLALGIYAEVLAPGAVELGDEVRLLS